MNTDYMKVDVFEYRTHVKQCLEFELSRYLKPYPHVYISNENIYITICKAGKIIFRYVWYEKGKKVFNQTLTPDDINFITKHTVKTFIQEIISKNLKFSLQDLKSRGII